MASTSGGDGGYNDACGGCMRITKKPCEGQSCVFRACLEALWPNNLEDQGDGAEFLTETFTRGQVLEWLTVRSVDERPEFILKLLLTAQGLFDDKRSQVQALLLKAVRGNASKFCTKSDCPPLFTDLTKDGPLCGFCELATRLVEGVMDIQKTAEDPGPELQLNIFVKLLLTLHSILNVNLDHTDKMRAFMVETAKKSSECCDSGCPDVATAMAKETTLCASCQLAEELYNAFSEMSGQEGDDPPELPLQPSLPGSPVKSVGPSIQKDTTIR